MRNNCQIESDVCVCCKRDSKSPHCLSTHEQEKKKRKKSDFTSVGIFKRQARTKLNFDFFSAILLNKLIFFFLFQEAFRTRLYVFGYNNLHVATAHEDLGYALYVHEYSTGDFDEAR